MSQLQLPATELSPALIDRLSKIAEAAKAISNAATRCRGELRGFKQDFPSSYDVVLSHLDLSIDQLRAIVSPKHFVSYRAEDSSGRNSDQQGSGAQTPAQDGRAETDQ